ncbi:hypothetical protein DFH07DRAFT_737270, partial [Mycena maculata]
PVLTLPPKIVAKIFIQCIPAYPDCPPLLGPHSPNTLAQICGTWREITLLTPALWRAFGVRYHNNLKQMLFTLGNFLGRSRSCPLSMNLFTFDVEPFQQTISTHRAHWEHLKFNILNFYFASFEGPASIAP